MDSAAALRWATLPRFAQNALEKSLPRLRDEAPLRVDEDGRRALALWMRHMIGMGVVHPVAVARAMNGADPFRALRALYRRTCNRLARSLEATAIAHSLGVDRQFSAAIEISSAEDVDGEPTLQMQMGGYYNFSVSSLHHTRRRLAGLVHEVLDLVSYGLTPCLLPHDTWENRFFGAGDLANEEYEVLLQSGFAENPKEACEQIERGEFFHFSSDPKELVQQLAHHHMRRHCEPSWMRGFCGKRAVVRARQLERAAHQYAREYGAHPWSDYVQYVVRALRQCLPREGDLERQRAHQKRIYAQLGDGAAPFFCGLWVESGTSIEHQHVDALYYDMGQTGEAPTMGYVLSRITSKQLQARLFAYATALGLLLRAEAINRELLRSRHARSSDPSLANEETQKKVLSRTRAFAAPDPRRLRSTLPSRD